MPMLPVALVAVAAILYVAIAMVLVRKYLRSHDVGFAWLGVAVIVWPLLSQLLQYGVRIVIDRFGSGPFYAIGDLVLTIKYAQQTVSLVLLFVAVRYLSKTSGRTDLRVA
jgi:hypothetical protein